MLSVSLKVGDVVIEARTKGPTALLTMLEVLRRLPAAVAALDGGMSPADVRAVTARLASQAATLEGLTDSPESQP